MLNITFSQKYSQVGAKGKVRKRYGERAHQVCDTRDIDEIRLRK